MSTNKDCFERNREFIQELTAGACPDWVVTVIAYQLQSHERQIELLKTKLRENNIRI